MANTKSSSTDTSTNRLAALTAEQRKALTSILEFCKEKSNAPAYNKGGYQYISDDTDLTTMGRKV